MEKNALINLIFPSRCAVCDCSGQNLCQQCKPLLLIDQREFQLFDLQILTVLRYTDETSKILVALKDKGQSALIAELSEMLKPVVDVLPACESTIYLVPAPSRPENFSRRGFQPMLLLAKKISEGRSGIRVLNCLNFARSVQDQVGLSEHERMRNLSMSMVLNQKIAGRVCYLLDDVVSTGATALEAARVLRLGKASVAGVLAISYSKG